MKNRILFGLVAVILLVSLGLNAWNYATKFFDGLRLEGYQIAVVSIVEAAQKDGQVVINYKDKDGKAVSLTLFTKK